MTDREETLGLAHWGTFTAAVDGGDIGQVTPWSGDDDPSPALGNLAGSVTHRSRVARPAVRRGWWEGGPGPTERRGLDPFVSPPWDEVLDALAAETARVIRDHGNAAIYGGSYGWASAGRFHHAQSQLHRFLNCLGGYTASINTYSNGASEVMLPRIIAPEEFFTRGAIPWEVIAEHTELLVAVGGLSRKNTGTDAGGTSAHPTRAGLQGFRARGGRLVNLSPLRDDGPGARWAPVRPGTDTALLLALTHSLVQQGFHDQAFLSQYCVGWEEMAAYLAGETDGVPKTPAWASDLCGVPERTIDELAHDMATHRTLVTVGWSTQRARFGEQVLWAGVALAAALGQIGLPGGGFGSGYGSMNAPGLSPTLGQLPRLPQGVNPISLRIPVARISDLLLHPGSTIRYDGQQVVLPDVRLVWWAGGNPFHHHQDLGRLRGAFGRPDTVVVNDPYWTATARHADVILPSTTAYERDDLGGSRSSASLVAMRGLVPAWEQARDDYDIYSALAARLGIAEAFTQGRSSDEWLRHLYDTWTQAVAVERNTDSGSGLPDFDQFWRQGIIDVGRADPTVAFAAFRADPATNPLATPSGRIELASSTIGGFDLPDCPGHPTFLPDEESHLGRRTASYPLVLLANQPRGRLHSQLDFGDASQATRVAGREPVRMHPHDAAERDLTDGSVVRVHNDRGTALAGLVLDDGLLPGVVQMSTGAWFDPLDERPDRDHYPHLDGVVCVNGNPNVLTRDVGTSGLAQGCTGARVLVEVSAIGGPVPDVRIFDPPPHA